MSRALLRIPASVLIGAIHMRPVLTPIASVNPSGLAGPVDVQHLHQLIDCASYWRISLKGKTKSLFLTPIDDKGRTIRRGDQVRFSVNDFMAIDPRFQEVFFHLTIPVVPGAQFLGAHIDAMRNYWCNQSDTFPEEAFDTPGLPDNTARVLDVLAIDIPRHSTMVMFTVKTYSLSTTKSGIVFAQSYAERVLRMNRSWVDAAYPNWLARHNVCLSLDTGVHTAARQALNMDTPSDFVPQGEASALPDTVLA